MAGMMTYAKRTRFPFHAYPGIAGWYERIESLPSWQATAAGPWR